MASGFVSLHELESDCYYIKDIKTKEEVPLMQRIGTFEQQPNQFKFFPEGVKLGNNCFKELLAMPPDIAVVDEIGGYELAGELWSISFTQLIESSIPLIFTVKAKQLETVLKKWSIEPTFVFQADDFGNPLQAVEQIKSFL